MSAIAIAVKHMLDAGMPSAAIVAAVAEMEAAIASVCEPLVKDYNSNKARRRISKQRWKILREETFRRDEWTCVYCGAQDDLTCDHIIPLARGGTNDNENLATACRSCNSSKGKKTLKEWAGI